MAYTVKRDGRNMGTWSDDGLARQLTNGVLLPTDLAFIDDKQTWVPIAELPKSEAAEFAEFSLKAELATPRAFVTPAIIALNVVVFTAMIGAVVSPGEPPPGDLIHWGAVFGLL